PSASNTRGARITTSNEMYFGPPASFMKTTGGAGSNTRTPMSPTPNSPPGTFHDTPLTNLGVIQVRSSQSSPMFGSWWCRPGVTFGILYETRQYSSSDFPSPHQGERSSVQVFRPTL